MGRKTSSVTMEVYISRLPVDVSGDMELVELVNLGQLRTICKYHTISQVPTPISPCTRVQKNRVTRQVGRKVWPPPIASQTALPMSCMKDTMPLQSYSKSADGPREGRENPSKGLGSPHLVERPRKLGHKGKTCPIIPAERTKIHQTSYLRYEQCAVTARTTTIQRTQNP